MKRQRTIPEENQRHAKGGRRRILRIVSKILLYGTLLFFMAALGGYLLLQNETVQGKIKESAVTLVEKKLHARLQVGKVGGNLLYNLSLEEVSLTGEEGLLFKADRITANYLGPLLLKGIFLVKTLRVDGLHLNLKEEPDGEWNITKHIPAGGGGDSSFELILRRVSLSDAEVVLTTGGADNGEVRRLRGLNLTADIRALPDSSSEGGLSIEIGEGAFALDRPDVTLIHLTGTLFHYPGREMLRMEELKVRTVESEVILNGSVLLARNRPDLDLQLDMPNISLPEVRRALQVGAPLYGEVNGFLSFKGPLDRLYHKMQLRLAPLTVESGGYLDLTGEKGFGFEATGSIRHLDPARLPFSEPTWPSGDIQADFSLKGSNPTSSSPALKAALSFRNSRVAGYRVNDGEVDLAFDGRALKIDNGSFAGPLGRVDLKGDIEGISGELPGRIGLVAFLRDFDVGRAFPSSKLQGRLNFDIRAEGSAPALTDLGSRPSRASARITAGLKPSSVAGFDIREGEVEAVWKNGEIDLKRFEVSGPTGRMAVIGSAVLKKNIDLSADLLLPDLTVLPPLLSRWLSLPETGRDASGALEVSVELKGDWSSPEAAATLKGKDVRLNELSASLLRFSGKWRSLAEVFDSQSLLELENFDLRGNRFSHVKAKTRLLPDKAFVELDVRHQRGEEASITGAVAGWSHPIRKITVDRVVFKPRRGSPLGRTAGRIENRGPIRLSISPEYIHIPPANLSSGKTKMTFEGRLAREGDQDLKVLIQEMPLEGLAWLWKGEGEVRGVLSASFYLSGTAEDPKIASQFKIEGGSGYGFSFERLEAGLRFEESTAYLEADLFRQGNRVLNMKGKAGFALSLLPLSLASKPGSLELDLETETLSLSELPMPKIPGVDLAGFLTLKARATGDPENPTLKGRISFIDGTLSLRDPDTTYDVSGEADFTQNDISVRKILIQDKGDGTLTMSGRIGLRDFRPVELDIEADGKAFFVPIEHLGRARATPNLKLSGPLSSPRLTGSITLNEARVDLERFQEDGPAEIEIIRAETEEERVISLAESERDGLGFLHPLSAGVVLHIPKDAWITGEGVNAEIGGQIELKKDPGKDFIVLGRLRTIRGTYEFQGKIFKITEGAVQFMGLSEPNPKLDIRAETKIRQVTIIVAIGGTAKEMQLSLSSHPQMDQTDIISYLVFGKPAGSLNAQQSLNAEGAALSLGGQIAASQLKKVLGDVLSLDMITVDTGGENVRAGSLSMGKYITEDIFVTYKQGFSAESPSELDVTYEITPNFSIETQLGEEYSGGIDFFWQFDFGSEGPSRSKQ